MATVVNTNSTSWTLIGTGLSTSIIQVSGLDASLFIGGSTPADADSGYSIPPGVPVNVPHLSALGGGLWAKGKGSARHDSV
jgi:hypothetical protein